MEIKCKFQTDDWKSIARGHVYTCLVESCSITRPGLEITSFIGQHEASKDNKDVQAISFCGTEVHYIPRNLTKVFPNLVSLLTSKCGLKEVSADDLVGLEKLEVLWILDNKVKTVPLYLFRNTPNLKIVSFRGNLIQEFDVNVLEPIKNIVAYFNISDNPGINEHFTKNAIKIDEFIGRLKLSKTNREHAKSCGMISQRLESLFDTGKHSDFTIKLRDKKYRVHKCILASQSSVFDSLHSDNAGSVMTFENSGNFSQEVVEEFLRYFYTRADPTEANAINLLELAVKFDVPVLKLQCEIKISQTIKPDNALQVFNFAALYSLMDLQRSAFDVIKEMHPEIAHFLYDKPEVVNAIIEAKDEFQAKRIKLEKE